MVVEEGDNRNVVVVEERDNKSVVVVEEGDNRNVVVVEGERQLKFSGDGGGRQ